jgi:cell division protein FtsW (lipid II flippase)
VIIAAFLMGLVTFGLSLLNVPGIVMSVIIGAMLIVVISLPIITRRMMQRRRFNFPSPWPSPQGEGRGEGKRISQNQH